MSNPAMIKIRRLASGDGHRFRELRLEALKNAPDAFGSSYEAEAKLDLSDFKDRVASGCIFGAFDGDELVGTVGFYQQAGQKLRHRGVL